MTVHHRIRCRRACGMVLAVGALTIPKPALGTWSIVFADAETKEVAVGTVTCLDSFDLLAIVPVVVVGKGAAAVQAAGDFNGQRRPIIFEQLAQQTSPAEILNLVSAIAGHQDRQYGIADTLGRTTTFTGTGNGSWAGGAVGSVGNMAYSIQGNVLAGNCIVPAIEAAVLTTAGDVPEKLMAGMEAAQLLGGDGRCSCNAFTPTICGCPPSDFTKVGHIGGMIVSRVGDTDDAVCNGGGCADGDYFMRLNVAFQDPAAVDPVDQLRNQFDAWRAALVGSPDGVQSIVTLDDESLPFDGPPSTTMHITLLDWQQQPISAAINAVTVTHAADSAGIVTIGPAVEQTPGVYDVVLTANASIGMDVFTVTIDDGVRPVVIMPRPTLAITAPLIPTVSSWGVFVLFVGMASAGVVLARKPTLR